MSDLVLTPCSALDRVLVPGHYGVEGRRSGRRHLRARPARRWQASWRRKGKTADLCARVKERFGVDLPMTPRRVADGPVHFIWAGPGRWLAEAPDEMPSTFERNLRNALSGLASVTSQSDGRSIIRISGPKAREALAKGVPLDLDPRVFGPGDTAMTVVAHINVHFWQTDAVPTYDFAVFRSFAAKLLRMAPRCRGRIRHRGIWRSTVGPPLSST